MVNISEIKERRFLFLSKVYKVVDGNQSRYTNMRKIGEELGFDSPETSKITNYLVGESLIEPKFLGGGIGITHLGIKEIESAFSKPDISTHYFPPVNVINIHQMKDSQIQQGTVNSTQSIDISTECKKNLEYFIDQLISNINVLNINVEEKEEIETEVATIKAQLKSKKPKTSIFKACLTSIKSILENTGGSLIAQQLLENISPLLSSL